MDVQLAGFLIALAVAALLAGPCAGALRRHPGAFYAAAALATAAYVAAVELGVRAPAALAFMAVLQKGYLSILLLAVVMFTGCFDEGTPARKHLQPVRGELSVLSFVFVLGHIVRYLPSYIGRMGALFAARPSLGVSIVVALVLACLFAMLAVTSLRCLRKRMGSRLWKNLQRFAYLMVALLAVHIVFVLGRSAFSGAATTAAVSFAAYSAAIAAYVVLRVRKAVRDGRRRAGHA